MIKLGYLYRVYVFTLNENLLLLTEKQKRKKFIRHTDYEDFSYRAKNCEIICFLTFSFKMNSTP
jgi:hypothetical protein